MKDKLKKIEQEAIKKLSEANTLENLEIIEKEYLGKKSPLSAFFKTLATATPEEKRELGPAINAVKVAISEKASERKIQLEKEEIDRLVRDEWLDVTMPGREPTKGHIHPINQLIKEVEEIFSSMGFAVKDGPEVESEMFNFENLNIPKTHPARDMQDTFFLKKDADEEQGKLVLRTHTSPVQIRSMKEHGAPLRIIVPGRVFRNEAVDATHDATFYQVEGLMIDENISLADLKGVMLEFLKRLFGYELNVRFRPGYFPFVEPGIELDIHAPEIIKKNNGYLEFMGAGMVHPEVLKAGGIDPEKYQGWAFGFGLTRLAMMRHKIKDIRHLSNGDLRFNKQF